MAKHTEDEMYQLPLADLLKGAAEPEQAAAVAVAEPPADEDEDEVFVARRELDLGEGAGMEVFEAEGATEKEALENLADKMADAKLNASRKIRQQEAELKDFRSRSAEPPQQKTISDDDEYVYSQELQKKPFATLRKMWKEATGYELEDFVSTKQAADKIAAAERTNQAINTFITTHSDYEDQGDAGTRNGQVMRMKLAEMGVPATSENLSKAYSQLKQSGLLLLKGEEANSDTDGKTTDTERIAQPKVEPAPQRTRKTSTISTHNRATVTPVSTEPSEDEQYTMPMEKLRQLANKQMATPR